MLLSIKWSKQERGTQVFVVCLIVLGKNMIFRVLILSKENHQIKGHPRIQAYGELFIIKNQFEGNFTM